MKSKLQVVYELLWIPEAESMPTVAHLLQCSTINLAHFECSSLTAGLFKAATFFPNQQLGRMQYLLSLGSSLARGETGPCLYMFLAQSSFWHYVCAKLGTNWQRFGDDSLADTSWCSFSSSCCLFSHPVVRPGIAFTVTQPNTKESESWWHSPVLAPTFYLSRNLLPSLPFLFIFPPPPH